MGRGGLRGTGKLADKGDSSFQRLCWQRPSEEMWVGGKNAAGFRMGRREGAH